MLKPGKDLDALVAQKVFGLKVKRWSDNISGNPDNANTHYWYEIEGDKAFTVVPPYSTDIKAAWEVAAKFPDRFMVERVYHNGEGWVCELALGHGGYWAHGHTAEHAICLAALEAIKGEND